MLVLRRLFRFYINASIHVALAVVALYLVNVASLNILVNYDLVCFLFLATIVCYNFVKYGVEAEKYLIVSKPSHRPIQVFSFLAFGACLYCFFKLSMQLWLVIAFLTLISGLYAIPLLPSSRNLRSLGGLKIFLVAAVWVGFTLVLPAVEHQLGFSKQLWLLGFQNFVLVLILILPFEVRDLQYDTPDLKTLPQRFGIGKTKLIGYCLMLVYFLMTYLQDRVTLMVVLQQSLLCILLFFALYFTKKRQHRYFSSFWVEGIPIAWALSIKLLKWVL
ncbi:MAG: hypothetical protein AAGC45_06290 [Bacteroidota bacterium]